MARRARQLVRAISALAALLLLAACFDPSFQDPLHCDAANRCPDGYVCAGKERICYRNGQEPAAIGCPPLATVGTPCAVAIECGQDGYCLTLPDQWPASGYCTRSCDSDADCEPGSFCSAGQGLCLVDCSSCDRCAETDHSCVTSVSGGSFNASGWACLPANAGGAAGGSCTSFGDCHPAHSCKSGKCTAP